jgi:hypothetical protein
MSSFLLPLNLPVIYKVPILLDLLLLERLVTVLVLAMISYTPYTCSRCFQRLKMKVEEYRTSRMWAPGMGIAHLLHRLHNYTELTNVFFRMAPRTLLASLSVRSEQVKFPNFDASKNAPDAFMELFMDILAFLEPSA